MVNAGALSRAAAEVKVRLQDGAGLKSILALKRRLGCLFNDVNISITSHLNARMRSRWKLKLLKNVFLVFKQVRSFNVT